MSTELGEDAVFEPKRIQVFGVLHAVFGGIGLMNAVMTVLTLPFMGAIYDAMGRMMPEGEEEAILAQKKFYADTALATWLGTIMTTALAVLLVLAGIGLIKRRQSGLKWSNRWAVFSLINKLISIPLFLSIMPNIMELMRSSMGDIPPASAEPIMNVMKVVMVVFFVTLPLVMAVYPILALKMLNKDSVRHWLN